MPSDSTYELSCPQVKITRDHNNQWWILKKSDHPYLPNHWLVVGNAQGGYENALAEFFRILNNYRTNGHTTEQQNRMHHLSAQCQDCGFHNSQDVTEIYGYASRGFPNDERALLTDDAYDAVLRFITEFHQHLSDTSHSGALLKHTHACLDAPNKALIQFDTFQSCSREQFTRLIAEYIKQLIGRAEVVKGELAMIDSLILTDADTETLNRLREQGFTNRQIITHFFNQSTEQAKAPKEGQSHLELDETTLKSTGKSVPIEEFLAEIDKRLAENEEKS